MKEKKSVKKKISLAVAGVLAAALAIGGAMAWTDYTQSVRNTFNIEADYEVLLHDDFDGENKDVYVENTGSNDVYVRVKFVEYLQIGADSILPAFGTDSSSGTKADPNDETTWQTHRFVDANMTDNKCSLVTHDYFTWIMSGAKKEYLANVTGVDQYGRGGLTQDEFDALVLGAEFMLGDETTKKMETLEESDLMMLSTWLDMTEKPEKACWLLDTDGWAYWSAPLKFDTATNLFLDSVVTHNSLFYDNEIYHIDVQLQAATIDEITSWYKEGIADVADPDNSVATVTANGHNFINYLKGEEFTYKWVELADEVNVYQELAVSSINGSQTLTGNYKLAGNDEDITTEDDNNDTVKLVSKIER